MTRIALSYRRADSAAISGRIFDRLTQRYGDGSVFMDIDEIPFGIDFRTHIAEVLSSCDAVVVIIGPRWAGAEAVPRRIDQETDPVRVEVQGALERGVPLIPILVDGALMPEEGELPGPLKPLAYRNACQVDTGRDFHAHVDRMIRSMDRLLAAADPRADAPAAAPETVPRPRSPAAAPARPAPPLGTARAVLLTAFLALPQAAQFAQRTPLFVLALLVSVIGTATILDREDRPAASRITAVVLVIVAALVIQGSLGLLRASLTDW